MTDLAALYPPLKEGMLLSPSYHSGFDFAQRVAGPEDEIHRRLREALPVRSKYPEGGVGWNAGPGDEGFMPVLSDVVYGDGGALLSITTFYDDPARWLVRIDTGWWDNLWDEEADGSVQGQHTVGDYMSHILENLAIEFGDGQPHEPHHDEEEDDHDRLVRESGEPYPAIDPRGGGGWRRVDWPEAGFERVIHPWNPEIFILKEDGPAVSPTWL